MELYAPNYYKTFKCIADKCRHSCCVGWEIDIDNETYELYKNLNSDFGYKLKRAISIENGIPHFILDNNERCPFLNENNLCDIITELGENAFCQICDDHPRFRNFFSHRIEIGLGLCCEESARIVLTQDGNTTLEAIECSDFDSPTSEEIEFLTFREKIFNILQDRNKSINIRVCDMLEFANVKLSSKSFDEWSDIYLNLEQLNPEWTEKLNTLKYTQKSLLFEGDTCDIAFEKLLIYFVYRHLADGLFDNTIKERVAFSVHALYMIMALCNGDYTVEKIIETSRMYSSEIEYSDENMTVLLGMVCDS